MATHAYLPFSTGSELVSKGDIIELVTGEKVTFLEMKRTKWLGDLNGRRIIIPVYRIKPTGLTDSGLPFAKAIVGRNEAVVTVSFKPNKLKFGDIFYLEGHKETFIFISNANKRGKSYIEARDLASSRNFTIDPSMTIVKVDLKKIKEEISNVLIHENN